MLTQKELKRRVHYNPETGMFTWKVPNERAKVGDFIKYKDSNGYIWVSLSNKRYRVHRLAVLYMKGYFPEHTVDHKDRVRHHNWWDNLREATQQCQNRNKGNQCNNTSGVKGVSFCNYYNKWRVVLKINGKQVYGQYFLSFNEAVCHRLAAEQCVDWDGCDSTSPAYKYIQNNI